MNNLFKIFIITFSTVMLAGTVKLLAQNNGGIWIDPNRSDPNKRRTMIMNGNEVETVVGNWGNVGGAAYAISGVWPRGSAHAHIHEFTGLIAAQVIDSSGAPVVIISDGYVVGDGTEGEVDPVTNIEYRFHPLPGYFNEVEGQNELANSLNPKSWPLQWPGKDDTWDGKWNGFFGQNQFNADQEAMYYLDETYNKEFRFFPFEGDYERQGLGMQIHNRLFQWSHPLAKDVLFFYFEVTNIGDYNYDIDNSPIFFGGFGDIGLGGRGSVDDDAAFDPEIDMVYGWDHDNMGAWTRNRDIPPGFMGWKFLESPGIEVDGLDNDNDGLTDERRDNSAGGLVFGPVGKYGEPKEHWEGDEDGDWLALVDDVGADGIMEFDEGYPGPDADGTENNGQPDQGEPNFGRLDNDESDQVGLTSFSAPLYGSILISDEEAVWPRLQSGYYAEPTQSVNQFWLFASGPFNLPSDKTERFSTCFAFGFTEQALYQTAGVAQRIFDSDYRFAKPPRQPVLKAIPGEGQVTLIWDDLAELSRDPIYGFDFEGYRIYRSTDPQFLDVDWVTDARGNPLFRKPIAQLDLNNGLNGPHALQFGEEIEQPTGVHYYMGDDTGLQHYFIDKDLTNGRVYYYAVTAYDKGYNYDYYDRGLSEFPQLLPITPAESPASIVVHNGVITRMDPNTVKVTPNPKASNLTDAYINDGDTLIHLTGASTGRVNVSFVDEEKVPDGDYEVTFATTPGEREGEFETSSYSVYDRINETFLLENEEVPWAYHLNHFNDHWVTELFDQGIIMEFENNYPSEEYIKANSGWSEDSQCNYKLTIGKYALNSSKYPVSFTIEFGDSGVVADSAFKNTAGFTFRPVDFKVYDYQTKEPLNFILKQEDGITNGSLELYEYIYHVFKDDPDARRYSTSWSVLLEEPKDQFGNSLPREEWIRPQPGDKINIINEINFFESDTLEFKTFKRELKEGVKDKSLLAKVKVVPNPYVVSSILEQQPFLSGRGERFIRFTHLPKECTVRIFTVNGDLVQTLHHNSIEDGTLRWDLKTIDNLEVAFGLYIYHVDAPGVGTKIGKFSIIN